MYHLLLPDHVQHNVQSRFVSGLCADDGILLCTTKPEGFPVHETMREFEGQVCNESLKFESVGEANDWIDFYHDIKLPLGKIHSHLVIVEVDTE